MCIRDRFTVGGTFTASKQIKDFSLGGFARFEYYNTSSQHSKVSTDGGMAVSYTHLDVYKRQPILRAAFLGVELEKFTEAATSTQSFNLCVAFTKKE